MLSLFRLGLAGPAFGNGARWGGWIMVLTQRGANPACCAAPHSTMLWWGRKCTVWPAYIVYALFQFLNKD